MITVQLDTGSGATGKEKEKERCIQFPEPKILLYSRRRVGKGKSFDASNETSGGRRNMFQFFFSPCHPPTPILRSLRRELGARERGGRRARYIIHESPILSACPAPTRFLPRSPPCHDSERLRQPHLLSECTVQKFKNLRSF